MYSTEGVIYTLRFGEVLVGPDANSDLSGDSPSDRGQGGAANRYLFISCEFDPSYFPEPAKPTSMDFQNKPEAELTDFDKADKDKYTKHQAWERKVQTGRDLAARLNARFADWYYVISDDSFKKIHLSKAELTSR